MTDEDALVRAVIADPDDDAPRLIYADWLDEHGQSERAEFIRVQIALAVMTASDPRWRELVDRERGFLTANWLPPLPSQLREWSFHRGFVNRVTYETIDFVRGIEAIFRAAPIRHVRLRSARNLIQELLACSNLARLVTLDLSYNSLGDVAIQALCRCPHVGSLLCLNLTSNRLRRSGAHALATSPYLTSLNELQLGRNSLLTQGDGASCEVDSATASTSDPISSLPK